jgi:hypothetical protein
MTRDETIDLLTLAAAYDRRKPGNADIDAWHLAVGDLSFEDSKLAVAGHYRDCADWLMPAHVRVRVKAIRAERIAHSLIPAPDPDLDPAAHKAALAGSVRMAADGLLPPAEPIAAIAGPASERRHGQPAALSQALAETRAALAAARRRRDAAEAGEPQ